MSERNTFERVYSLVAKIPSGKVATYGQIAMHAGMPRGARVVGYAMRVSPKKLNLPCHRVVNRLGELAPEEVFGGQGYQRMLLESEGVPFLQDGRIDLSKALYSWENIL